MNTATEVGLGQAEAQGPTTADGAAGAESTAVAMARLAGSPALRDLGRAVLASTAGALAVYLVGALAVQLRGSLHFGPSGLGLAFALFYVGAGLGAVPLGRLTERIGAPIVMRSAALGAAILLLLIATWAHSLATLAGLLVCAGVVASSLGPATNLFLARRIRPERQGVAYGIKQATIPLAATCAGIAVPAIGLSVGWRWAFVLAAVVAGLAALSIPRGAVRTRVTTTRRPDAPTSKATVPQRSRRPLIVLAVGFTLSLFSVNGLNAFLVTAAVSTGFSKADAGLLAALGAGLTVATRIGIGFAADRYGRNPLRIVLGMVLLGSIGYGMLSTASATHELWLFGLGAVIAYSAGWGWNGLFNYVIVRAHIDAPARATSIIQVGGCTAGVLGPLTFGLLVVHGSYSLAWASVGAAMLAGCAVIAVGKVLLSHQTALSGASSA